MFHATNKADLLTALVDALPNEAARAPLHAAIENLDVAPTSWYRLVEFRDRVASLLDDPDLARDVTRAGLVSAIAMYESKFIVQQKLIDVRIRRG